MSLIAGRQISGSVASASYATTASFALNGGGGSSIDTGSFAITGSNTFIGNQTITGSLNISGSTIQQGSLTATSFTGSLQGTASYATTSSYVLNAVSSSFSTTASYVQNAQTASYVQNAQSASYVLQAISSSFTTTSSYALTAETLLGSVVSASYSSTSSYALNADLLDGKDSTIFATTGSNVFIGNQTITGSLNISGSTIQQGSLTATSFSGSLQGIATTASYVQNAQSASYVLNAVSSSFATTASYVLNAISSSFATTASYALTAQTLLGSVVSASYASTSSLAQSVEFEGKPLSPGYPNNYILPVRTSTGAISLAAGSQLDTSANIRYYPIQLSRDTLISSIGALVRSTGAATTGSYRLGIYNSFESSSTLEQGATALPGTLLGDYGLVSQIGISAAFTEIQISDINRPILRKGSIYWLAISPSGSGTQAPSPTNGTVWNDYFGATPSSTTITSYVGLSVPANGGAALPNPANTASISLLSSNSMRAFPILKITGSIV